MREREQERADLQARFASFTGLEGLQTCDPQQLRRKATARLTQWHRLLTRDMAQTRQIRRQLRVGRLGLAFDAKSATCEIRGQGAFDPILAGILGPKALVSQAASHALGSRKFAGLWRRSHTEARRALVSNSSNLNRSVTSRGDIDAN